MKNVRVKRYDQSFSVDERCPQPYVYRRLIAHHPSEKHAYSFAAGRSVYRYYSARPVRLEVGADGFNCLVCVSFRFFCDEFSERTVFIDRRFIGSEKSVHRRV